MHSKALGGGGGVSDTGLPVFVRGSHELSHGIHVLVQYPLLDLDWSGYLLTCNYRIWQK